MTFLYVPRFGGDPDMTRCRASVHEKGRGFWVHQCTNAGTIDRGGVLYCKMHDPVAVKEKNDARNAKWQAKWEAQQESQAKAKALRDLEVRALDALRKIAAGHNDPRGLALEVLGDA